MIFFFYQMKVLMDQAVRHLFLHLESLQVYNIELENQKSVQIEILLVRAKDLQDLQEINERSLTNSVFYLEAHIHA